MGEETLHNATALLSSCGGYFSVQNVTHNVTHSEGEANGNEQYYCRKQGQYQLQCDTAPVCCCCISAHLMHDLTRLHFRMQVPLITAPNDYTERPDLWPTNVLSPHPIRCHNLPDRHVLWIRRDDTISAHKWIHRGNQVGHPEEQQKENQGAKIRNVSVSAPGELSFAKRERERENGTVSQEELHSSFTHSKWRMCGRICT